MESDSSPDTPRIAYNNDAFSMEPGVTVDEGSKKKKKKKEIQTQIDLK
jgi:hypothetical protein